MAMLRSEGGNAFDDLAGDLEFAAADFLEAGDHPQQRGLAAAGWSDKHDELAAVDLDVHAMDDLDGSVGLAKLPQ